MSRSVFCSMRYRPISRVAPHRIVCIRPVLPRSRRDGRRRRGGRRNASARSLHPSENSDVFFHVLSVYAYVKHQL